MDSGIAFRRWGGFAFTVGNVLFLLNKINEMSRLFLGIEIADVITGESVLLVVVGQMMLIAGFIAQFSAYYPLTMRFG